MDSSHERDRLRRLALKDRALAVAAEGITIADARRPGRPLIYVNEGFERLTGYAAEEALGRNCSFLQGRGTDPATVEEIREGLRTERGCTVEILNYRKDGAPFWNRLSITPVRGEDGVLTHYIGIQSDVSQRRRAEEDLQQANEELGRINRALQRELDEAAEIQQAWLPETLPQVEGWRFAWSFTPCQELGGDSLDVLRLDEHHVALYVLDVTGHGVGAALLSASVQRGLSTVPEHSVLFVRDTDSPSGYRIAPPAVVAANLNRSFRIDPRSGRFFTLVYGILDLRTGDFDYVTAGHPAPLRVGPEGIEPCEQSLGVPIGVDDGFDYGGARIRLEPGERLLLYTDGATEAMDDREEPFSAARLEAALLEQAALGPDEALEAVMGRLRRWSGSHHLDDDITLLLVQRSGP